METEIVEHVEAICGRDDSVLFGWLELDRFVRRQSFVIVDGDKLYTLGAEGDLICFKAESGDIIWKKNLPKEYHTKTAMWGYASHPLIEGTIDLAFEEPPGATGERRAVVLDFKTDRELDVEGERYRRQLAIYCQALTALQGGTARGILMRV